MAGSVNKVILIGNLGQDPEVKSFQNGGRIANLRIATSESWKDKQTGERKERTEWHSVVLQSDGLVGVVEHRAKPDAPASYTDGNKGYMQERDIVAAFDKAGFALVGKSEINANPKDPANWPNGVWTLPPSLGGATDETRPKLLEIGESDRMTLLFRKKR